MAPPHACNLEPVPSVIDRGKRVGEKLIAQAGARPDHPAGIDADDNEAPPPHSETRAMALPDLVDLRGLEPLASRMRTARSPS